MPGLAALETSAALPDNAQGLVPILHIFGLQAAALHRDGPTLHRDAVCHDGFGPVADLVVPGPAVDVLPRTSSWDIWSTAAIFVLGSEFLPMVLAQRLQEGVPLVHLLDKTPVVLHPPQRHHAHQRVQRERRH